MNINKLKNQIMNILNINEDDFYFEIDNRKYHKNDIRFYRKDDLSLISIYHYRKDELEIIK